MPSRSSWLLLLMTPCAGAQELRHIDCPEFRYACFDPVRQRVLAPGIARYTEEWDGTRWHRAPDFGAPRGFCWWDASTARMFAFKDPSWTAGPASPLQASVRTGHAWQAVAATGVPSPRWNMSCAHDTARNEVVVFGGFTPPVLLGETWVFNGSAWTQRMVPGPAPRFDAAMTFDSVRQRVVLFGGTDATTTVTAFDDTWEWNGMAWTQVPTPTRPPRSSNPGAAYDPLRQRVVMLCRAAAATSHFEHWEYDGTTWTRVAAVAGGAAATPASAFAAPALVYDVARSEMLALGGTDLDYKRGRVLAWNGVGWSARPGFTDRRDPVYQSAVAPEAAGPGIHRFGGWFGSNATLSDELWTFNGGVWSLAATGPMIPRRAPTMWTMLGATFVFGGVSAGGVLGDTWRWNGTTWMPIVGGPPPRVGSAAAVDLAANRAILFGGDTSLGSSSNDTWTFDGVQWQQLFPLTNPPPLDRLTMAYDPLRNRTVLVGWPGSGLADTWEWNGTNWQHPVLTSQPPPTGTLTFDPARLCIVYCVPGAYTFGSPALWTFDGLAWAALPAIGAAPSLTSATAPYESLAVTSTAGRVFVVNALVGVSELLATPARASHYGAACAPDSPELLV
ncbi:MAG: kelch repeat-containing protein [Planctomycetota bacterium]